MEYFKLDNGIGWDGQPGRFRMNTRVIRIERDPLGGHLVTLSRKSKSLHRADFGQGLSQASSLSEPNDSEPKIYDLGDERYVATAKDRSDSLYYPCRRSGYL